MEIFRISACILCAVVLTTAINKYSQWSGVVLSMAVGVVTILYILPEIKLIADRLITVFGMLNSGNGYVSLLFRIIGISFVAQLTSQICTDAGQKAMGDKIELAARVFIAIYTLPLLSDILKLITGFLGD